MASISPQRDPAEQASGRPAPARQLESIDLDRANFLEAIEFREEEDTESNLLKIERPEHSTVAEESMRYAGDTIRYAQGGLGKQITREVNTK